jgi:hypothetical protein
VSTTEELLGKTSGSVLKNREYGRRDPYSRILYEVLIDVTKLAQLFTVMGYGNIDQKLKVNLSL